MIFQRAIASVLCVILFVSSSPPKIVRLGGLFPTFDFSGSAHTQARQLLSSFLMAVREINANPHLLPNTTILIAVRDSKLNVGKSFFASLDLATTTFTKYNKTKGIDACIGADSSGESEAAATVFTQFSTVQISYSSTSPLLSTKINYPYFARTCPSDAFQGAAMADLVGTYYGWRKVSTFANSDTYGSNGINQFQSSASNLGVEIISSSLLPVGQTNFAAPIADALRAGTRIFVFFMTAKDMGNLLLQGYYAGLFVEGTQIIASDASVASAALWANIPPAIVTNVMRGVIGFTPSSDYSSPEGQLFLKSLMKEKNTVANLKTGKCNNKTDDTGHFLFQEALDPNFPNQYNCSGTNFSKYYADGSNVDNYSPYAYDATYAIAKAMHVLLYVQQLPKIDGKGLYAALINNVSFVGVSGQVNFSHALTADSTRFGEGDRRDGISYKIMNFSPEVYNSDPSGSSGYIAVGGWTLERGNRISSAITYNTANNLPPSDLPPTIILKMSMVFMSILIGLGTFLFLIITFFAVITVTYRRTRMIKTIQLKMQLIILTGGYFAAARVISGSLPVSNMSCSMNVWFGHLAFWFIFTPMMLKTWRVHRIVNNKTLKRVTITENYICLIFLCIILVVVMYLAILQGISSFTPIKFVKIFSMGIQYYSDNQCTSKVIGFEFALIVAEAILLGTTAFYCYATKEVPGTLNEAQNNLKSISIVSCVAVVVVPLIFLTSIDEGTRQLFTSVCIFVCIFTTILILHSWRSVQLLGGYDIDSHLELIRKSNPQITDTLHSVTHHSGSQKDGYYGGNSLNPFEAVKTKNLLNRRQTCNEQVVHWTYLLRKTEALMLVQDEVRPRIIAVDGMHTHFPTVGEDALVEAKQFLS